MAAVRRDLAEIGKRDAKLAKSGLAVTALAMAREIDDVGNSATSKSMCATALHKALDRLRELLPPEEHRDEIDALQKSAADKLAR